MARIRSLKPEITTDRGLASVSREARYTFVLLITQADDEGLQVGETRQLLGALYPHDPSVRESEIESELGALLAIGLIRFRGTQDGARVIEICNWRKHQKIDRPAPSRLAPLLREYSESLATDSRAPRVEVDGSSLLDLGSRTMDLGPGTMDLGPTTTTAPSSPDWDGAELPPEGRVVLDQLARAHPRPAHWRCMVRKHGPGGIAERCTWPQLSTALAVFAASDIRGIPGEPMLVRFIDSVKRDTSNGIRRDSDETESQQLLRQLRAQEAASA